MRKTLVTLLACLAFVTLSASTSSAGSGVIYALRQVNGGANQIYGFRINGATGALTLLSGFPVSSGGIGGARSFSEHIAYRNGLLFVVNEGSASLSVLSVNQATGALTPTAFSPIALAGDLACVAAAPTGTAVVVGSNAGLWGLAITPTSGSVAAGSPVATSGASPFSCSFSRDGLFAYTGGNVGSVIAGFSAAPATGVLTPLAGSPFETLAATPSATRPTAPGGSSRRISAPVFAHLPRRPGPSPPWRGIPFPPDSPEAFRASCTSRASASSPTAPRIGSACIRLGAAARERR